MMSIKKYQYIKHYPVYFSQQPSLLKCGLFAGLMMLLGFGLLLNSHWLFVQYQNLQAGRDAMAQLASQAKYISEHLQRKKQQVDQLHNDYNRFAHNEFVHYQQLSQLCTYWLCDNQHSAWQVVTLSFSDNDAKPSIATQMNFPDQKTALLFFKWMNQFPLVADVDIKNINENLQSHQINLKWQGKLYAT